MKHEGVAFGHAGAIIEGKRGLPSEKIKRLQKAGVMVVEQHDQLGDVIREAI
jgi:succinyl-CoA synthetase alpha subunit